MFDLNKDSRVIKNDPDQRLYPPTAEAEPKKSKPDDMDSPEKQELHRKLMDFYRQEVARQQENRFQMAIDEDFYDHIQWSEEDAQVLKERGQAPLVYNVIAQSVNWVIGSEKRGRTDFKVLPRGKEDGKPAEHKTKLLKYLADVNKSRFHRSRAFEDAVKVGIGWLESAVQEDDEGEPIYTRYESWRNILHDSASTEMDGGDMRYLFRMKWADVDIVKALFEKRAELIEQSAVEGTSYGYDLMNGDEVMDQAEFERTRHGVSQAENAYTRRRVRLIECWYRKVVKVKVLKSGDFRGQAYEQGNPAHEEQLRMGIELIERPRLRMHVAIMTTEGMLWCGQSPYRHNKFPFTAIWGYRRGRDRLPYGIIRGVRDIQEDINKRASKALAILSSNKTIMEEGAVEDMDEFLDEVSRPDAVIVKRTGKELVINADRELGAAHLELMGRSISMIQQVTGVTDEQLGRTTNAVSGRAVQARQEQGALSTTGLFDNLRLAEQIRGEKELSLIEQFMSDHKQFRITNDRGTADYVTVNDGMPENDITRTQADFIIGEGEWRASMREAAAEQLFELIGRMPAEIAIMMLDLAVEAMDLPNRDELVKRIRDVNGMKDPDADPNAPQTPEDQAKAQQTAMQMEMQMRAAQADLADKEASAQLKGAQAQKAAVESEMMAAGVEPQTRLAAAKIAAEAGIERARIAAGTSMDKALLDAGMRGQQSADNAVARMAQQQQAVASKPQQPA